MPRSESKDGTNHRWLTLRRAAKVEAARQGKTLRQILVEALEMYLDRQQWGDG